MTQDRVGYVYILVNLTNGKGYVGQTVREPEVRWAEHFKTAFVARDKRPLYRAIRKYGADAFTAEVLWSGPESKLNAAEKRYVRLRKTYADGGAGYNLTTGGGRFKMSRATCRKISVWAKAYYSRPENKARISEMMKADWAKPDARDRRWPSPEVVARRAASTRRHYVPEYVRVNHGDRMREAYAADPARAQRVGASLKKFNAAHPEVRKTAGAKLRGAVVHTTTGKDYFRALAKAQWADPEARAKKLAGMRGKRRTGKALENIRAAASQRRGVAPSGNQISAMAAANRSLWATSEYREKMRALRIAAWRKRKERTAANVA